MTIWKTDPEWHHWHTRKEFWPERNVWVRKKDCLIAELMGYRWLPHNPKQDFCGYTFHNVLTPSWSELDAAYILEPDTRVPNFTTRWEDALKIPRYFGWETIAVLPTDQEMIDWICNKALA